MLGNIEEAQAIAAENAIEPICAMSAQHVVAAQLQECAETLGSAVIGAANFDRLVDDLIECGDTSFGEIVGDVEDWPAR